MNDGLQYLHSMPIVHRDLKPRLIGKNVFLFYNNYLIFQGSGSCVFLSNIYLKNKRLKIGDFGLAKLIGKTQYRNANNTSGVGTVVKT